MDTGSRPREPHEHVWRPKRAGQNRDGKKCCRNWNRCGLCGRCRGCELKRGLVWEQPIGVVQGVLEEPEAGYVDPHDAEEREAIQWLENEEKKGRVKNYDARPE